MFKEEYGDSFPSIRGVDTVPPERAVVRSVFSYLNDAPVCIASPGIVKSLFDPNRVAGSLSLKTDGRWVWSDTYAFYLSEGHVSIPEPFLQHMIKLKFVLPSKESMDLVSLTFPW